MLPIHVNDKDFHSLQSPVVLWLRQGSSCVLLEDEELVPFIKIAQ